MELKSPLTVREQIEKLKEHGMIIYSEDEALSFFRKVNYYRFTGYALEDRKEQNRSVYREGTSFERVRSRYEFDVEMRNILRKAIECAEVYYRTLISYRFSLRKCLQPPHDQHYNRNNYYRKENFDKLIAQISKEENYYRDSLVVRHHKKKYENKMPLWVLVEIMTISSLSKFYGCMYCSDQKDIAASIGTSALILKNHLHCLSIIRNKCAHAGRLYGKKLNPPARFGRNFLQQHPEIKTNTLFGYIAMIIQRLPDKKNKIEFINNVVQLTDFYISEITLDEIGFSESYTQVLMDLEKNA